MHHARADRSQLEAVRREPTLERHAVLEGDQVDVVLPGEARHAELLEARREVERADQVARGVGQATEAVAQLGLGFGDFVREAHGRQLADQFEARFVVGDPLGRQVGRHAELQLDTAQRLLVRLDVLDRLAGLHALDDLLQQAAVEVVADCRDVPGLFRAQHVAGAADLEVLHADREARAQLVHLLERLQALARDVAQGLVFLDQEVAVRLVAPAPDAAAQLVQLRQAEVVGVVHDDRAGRGDVEAGLDDRRRDEHVDVAAREGLDA